MLRHLDYQAILDLYRGLTLRREPDAELMVVIIAAL